MKKFLAVCFAFLIAFGLYAQRAYNVIVLEDFSAFIQQGKDDNRTTTQLDGDYRTGNLVQEYFISELATHSSINVLHPDMLNPEGLAKRGLVRGKVPTFAQLSSLCKDAGADYVCLVKINHKNDKKLACTITVVDKSGKAKSVISRDFDSVHSADVTSILLAREAAIAIRGHNPVDDINTKETKERLTNLMDQKKQGFSASGVKVQKP